MVVFLPMAALLGLILAQVLHNGTCQNNNCSSLSIDGANITYANSSSGLTATIACSSDSLARLGPKRLQCVNGMWSATQPACVELCQSGSYQSQFKCSSGSSKVSCSFVIDWFTTTDHQFGFFLTTSLDDGNWTGIGYNIYPGLAGSSWIYLVSSGGKIALGATALQGLGNSSTFLYTYASSGMLTAYFTRALSDSNSTADQLNLASCVYFMFAPGGGSFVNSVFAAPANASVLSQPFCFTQCGVTITSTTTTTTTPVPTLPPTMATVTAALLPTTTQSMAACHYLSITILSSTLAVLLLFIQGGV